MTLRPETSRYISSLAISLLLALPAFPQQKTVVETAEEDSVAFLHGFAVGVDLAGAVQKAISSYGQYEASLRVNLLDRYFPIVEIGLGRASYEDEITQISYESTAPYFRIGMDYNLMKNKHDDYRIYAGGRYAFTSFSYDISHPGVKDPDWGGVAPYGAKDVKNTYHWAEIVAGVDAKILGPVHLGWTVRYRKRIYHSYDEVGEAWYVPGFGESDNNTFGYTFVLSIDI